LYSGVSGLRNEQTAMDVIGNNIANVNTVGFKSSRVVFQDIYSQTIKPAAAPTTMGGSNPQQIGLGVTIAAIDVLNTRTGDSYTGNALDASIEGDGYFVVNDGASNYFTRAGNFYTDSNNDLVTADGLKLQKMVVDPTTHAVSTASIQIPANYSDISIDKDGNIIGLNSATNTKGTIDTICIATFNNQSALEKDGSNLYRPTGNSGAPIYTTPGTGSAAYLNPGALEMSNVDLAQEFTTRVSSPPPTRCWRNW
jgi:flagellar hook protein FlgE